MNIPICVAMSPQDKDLSEMTVDEVLRRWPQSAQVFRSYALACLGCAVGPFCEVTAVADIYDLPIEKFTADLRRAIEAVNSCQDQ